MSVGLLPLEKIPIFVWGAILALVGGVLVLGADAYSWDQLKAVAMVVLGLAAVAYDIARRNGRATEENGAGPNQEP